MALDNGYPVAAHALPTPTDTPYETPSRGISGQSSRQASSSPFSDYSPAPLSPKEETIFTGQQAVMELSEDKRYSIRDPRRLTPDLGISFVSQIHTLKNELDGRNTMIGSLEEGLHQTQAENEQLSGDLKAQRAEVKSVKQQMSSLEHDMLQALEKIAKERDNATEGMADTKKLLESSKKKVRVLEDEATKTNLQWEREKQEWDSDKRKLESKVHVVEERLKTMVAEMMAVHSTGQNRPGTVYDMDEGIVESWPVKESDIRALSRFSNRSIDDSHENKHEVNYRASRMSGLHEMGGSQMSGLSLADELEMTEDDEDITEIHEHGIYSPDALPEEIPRVARRYSEDKKARKVMGFLTDNHDKSVEYKKPDQEQAGIIEDYINLPGKPPPVTYADAETQYTPPPNPALQPKRTDILPDKSGDQTERSANQSRKRVAIPSIILEQPSTLKSEALMDSIMVSAGCQTEKSSRSGRSDEVTTNGIFLPVDAVTYEMRSTSTQTIEEIVMGLNAAGTRLSPNPLDVPVIAIHPPASRPASSHNSVVLPPRTRNAGCQATIEVPKQMTSTSMQTQEIRIDKRPFKIPPRLQPSSVATRASSRPTEKRTRTVRPVPSVSPRRRARVPPPSTAGNYGPAPAPSVPRGIPKDTSSKGKTEHQSRPGLPQFGYTYPGIDDRPSSSGKHGSGSGYPAISADIFAGFDSANEDIKADIADDLSDDDEFANAAPIRKTLSKVQNSWKLVPQSPSVALDESNLLSSEKVEKEKARVDPEISAPTTKSLSQTSSKTFQTKPLEAHRKATSATKPPDIRRKALVSNGIAEHTQRSRSPSAPSGPGKEPTTVPPPFPVPTRSSSRKIPISASDGAASPTPYTTSFFTARRGQDHPRPPIKRKILRKVQSAAAVPKAPERRPPPPPPSMSATSTTPGSPRSNPSNPAASNQFIFPYDKVPDLPSNVTPLPPPRPHAGEASIETPRQQTSVVDAIAQTMVGEWMWKYVRKRTSFGITENPQTEFEMGRNGETGSSSGIRHKRWVWLAPYENAVIWSSKQPTSGPALLGKGGRKLMIQSVLDVKDDTPLPKNASSKSAFDRSILILTPQRALKFTAVSRERHYIWLTALSFLSTQGMEDLASAPPLPQQEYEPPPSQEGNTTFRRAPVRDSIRIAKARSRPSLGAHSFSSPIGEVEKQIMQNTTMAWADKDVDSGDAAEPPQVPRTATHARKRSSTGPRPIPLSSLHSYPANGNGTVSSFSLQGPTSRDKYDKFMPRSRGASASGPNAADNTTTRCTSNPNRDSYIGPSPVVPDNFFDPAGTMRMEAFVVGRNENEAFERTQTEPVQAKKEARSYRTRQGRKKDLSYWGVAESAVPSGAERARMREEDPFTGF